MAVLPRDLLDRVTEIITRYSMLESSSRVGVAVSGGADSVVLLHLLCRLKEQFGANLFVLHVNHGWRGAESNADEDFVRSLANSLGLGFYSERGGTGEGNPEEQAREARRRFFRRMRDELGLNRVALGHTRSDQAETVLFRFLRGAGTTGLAGMRFVSDNGGTIRPLLATSRAEVRDWAMAQAIEWREDATNTDLRFRRNRLRLKTLPDLAASYNENLEAVLAGMAAVADSENDYWNGLISPLYDGVFHTRRLGIMARIGEIEALHPAVQRRLVRKAVARVRGDLRSVDLEHVDAVLRLCAGAHGHERVMIPGVDAMRSFETLLLALPGVLSQDRDYEVAVELGSVQELPFAAGSLCLEQVNSEPCFCANFKEEQYFFTERAELEWEALFGPERERSLAVRNWQPGDAIERPGRRPEKLKTLFQEHRVPLWARRHWPVLVAGTEIVWTRQFGCASKFQRRSGGKALRLIYKEPRDERI